jgi:hypothetical protein
MEVANLSDASAESGNFFFFAGLSPSTSGSRDAMPLQAPMQGRSCQVWNCWLKRVEAIIQRQQSVYLTEGDNDRPLHLNRQDCRMGSFGPVGKSAIEVRFFHFATVF